MAEINPLSFIGRSNDPSLTKRTVGASKALADLQRGQALQTLTNRGNLDRQGLANQGSLANAIVGQGFSGPSDPGFTSDALAKIRASEGHARDTLSALNLAKLGSRPRDIKGQTGLAVADPSAIQIQKTPLDTESATAANPAKAKEEAGKRIKSKKFFVPDPSARGGRREVPLPGTVEVEETQKSTREAKGDNLFEVTLDVLANIGLKRGQVDGKTVIYRILDNGEAEIIASQ